MSAIFCVYLWLCSISLENQQHVASVCSRISSLSTKPKPQPQCSVPIHPLIPNINKHVFSLNNPFQFILHLKQQGKYISIIPPLVPVQQHFIVLAVM